MILRRDPIGETTCYWTREPDGKIRSGSRLRDLMPDVREVEPAALRDYLACAFVPGEQTLVRGIRELRPGTVWDTTQSAEPVATEELREGAWDPDEPLESHARRLRPILEHAVAARLPGDPRQSVGVFLSGGLDSSLVTALVRRLHPGPVHTFSLHFGPETPSELRWSQAVADHCQTIHHVLEFDALTIRRNLPESIAALDDPIGDPLTTPNLLMTKAAKESEVEWMLNGEGGDPVFGGPKNLPMVLHNLYGDAGDDVRRAYFRSYQKCFDDLDRLWTPPARQEMDRLPAQEALLDPFLADEGNPMRSYLNRLMRINVRLKGADHILNKVACMARHTGVRIESPLFDTAVVEAGFAIPPRYKLDGSREKAVLKEAVRDLLPEDVVERPKSGMMVPVQRWFRGPLKPLFAELVLGKESRSLAWLERTPLEEWLAYRPMSPPRHGVKLWLVLTLEIWLRENGFQAPAKPGRFWGLPWTRF
jgi:asparagine synthase (glutamine-hydrolysing)